MIKQQPQRYMPEPKRGTGFDRGLVETMPQKEQPEPPRARKKMSREELLAYREWKEAVPPDVRAIVEARLVGRRGRVDAHEGPLTREFLKGMRALLEQPDADVSGLGVSALVERRLREFQNVQIGDESVNVYRALANEEVDFGVKGNYVKTKIEPVLAFLRARDRRAVEKALEQAEAEEAGSTDVTGEHESEEYSPHRGPESEKGEGLPDHAVATVSPFWGGLHLDDVYDVYEPATLRWKKSARRMAELPEQTLDETRARVYRSRVTQGTGKVKLPRGWGVDGSRLRGVEGATMEVDQDGIVRVVLPEGGEGAFSIVTAPSVDAVDLAPPEGEVAEVGDRFPAELLSSAQKVMREEIPAAGKIRRIASIIHKHLEYDLDPQWEAVYKADPSAYFEKMWENKKAKCDEANTMLVRLLTKLGIHARFAGGHSVRTRSQAGEALLLDGNRHAWAFGWDWENNEWVRVDATPAGDPNVDQDEQQEELGEGDYGDQEAGYMSEEDFEKRMQEAQKEEEEERERQESRDPVLKFAREAECSPEEAREVIEKIKELRRTYARVLRDADRQWQTLVRQNTRERIVDRGPVPMSHMDDIDPDELVAGWIELQAGERDPLIGEREMPERRKEYWFGGYEVYVACDLSGSMDETLAGVKKSDAQRDMTFLFVDSVMRAAVSARKSAHQLKAPMPTKVCVVVFGGQTEIALPLTGQWGAKEQYRLYRSLDQVAQGGTPDHDGLALVEREIGRSTAEEEKVRAAKPALTRHGWKTRRFVVATADGGSDKPSLTRNAVARLEKKGVPVDLFLIGPEGDVHLEQAAKAVYGSVHPLSDPGALAEKGLTNLTKRIKESYETPGH